MTDLGVSPEVKLLGDEFNSEVDILVWFGK
jgi:hypothetical protein